MSAGSGKRTVTLRRNPALRPLSQGKDKEENEVVHDKDEGIREGTSMESLAKLKDLKGMTSKGASKGMVTAGLASQICDGASAILICNEAGLSKLGLRPRAKIIGLTVAAADPVMMLSGPIPATEKLFERTGMTVVASELEHSGMASSPIAPA